MSSKVSQATASARLRSISDGPSKLDRWVTYLDAHPHTLTNTFSQIKYDELPSFTEVAAAGTAVSLVPIKSITMRSRNDKFTYRDGSDEPGPAVQMLLARLQAIQLGKVEDPFGWREPVREYSADEYDFEKGVKANGMPEGSKAK